MTPKVKTIDQNKETWPLPGKHIVYFIGDGGVLMEGRPSEWHLKELPKGCWPGVKWCLLEDLKPLFTGETLMVDAGEFKELLEYHCHAIDRVLRFGEERSDHEITLLRKFEALLG